MLIVPLPGSPRVTVPTAWAPSTSSELAMAPEQKSQQKNISSCLFFCSSTYSSRFWKLYMGTSVKEGKMVSLNACKMNINVLKWERSQCEMKGKMRECRIALPSVHGWDIRLSTKFRDILRYSVLQIPRALSSTCTSVPVLAAASQCLSMCFHLLCLLRVTFCW